MERYRSELNLSKEREGAVKFGVTVFILDNQDRVLTIKELEDKKSTAKIAGRYSVICETREPNEDWVENLSRGLEEELGISRNRFSDLVDFSEATIWEAGFVAGVWATVIIIICKNPDLLLKLVGSQTQPDEVEVVGWKSLAEFKSLDLRQGVRNILEKFEGDIFPNS